MKQASLFGRNSLLIVTAMLLTPSFVQAHTGVGATHGFSHGFFHPLTGLDHLCAMIAVGLWAAQLGGRALWTVPLTFISVMAVGGAMGVAGVPMPFVEQGIAASVLILGLLIAAAINLPVTASAPIVGIFALFHGHAHGAEMPVSASGLSYGIGFILATAMLHAVGIGFGIGVQRISTARIVRFAGAAITACGVYILCFGA
jgi:urease accessory protein